MIIHDSNEKPYLSNKKDVEKIQSVLRKILISPQDKQLKPVIQELKQKCEMWLGEYHKLDEQKTELANENLKKLKKLAEEIGRLSISSDSRE